MQDAKCKIILTTSHKNTLRRVYLRMVASYIKSKIDFMEAVARQTRSRVRSIVNLCEQLGYRSLTKQPPLKIDFYRAWEILMM